MAAGKSGVSHSTIAQMLSGHRTSEDSLRSVAEAYGGDAEKLLSLFGYIRFADDAEDVTQFGGVAVATSDPLASLGTSVDIGALGSIPYSDDVYASANTNGHGSEGTAEETLAEVLPGGLRAIRVKGRCMEPFYFSGDIVMIKPTQTAVNGDIIVATMSNGSVMCKRYRKDGLIHWLEDADGNSVEAQDFTIHGIVKGLIRIDL
jgi:hypothetical protein